MLALHVVPDDLLGLYSGACEGEVDWRPLLPEVPSRLREVLSNALGYAHMYQTNTRAMRLRLGRPMKASTRGRRAGRSPASTSADPSP